MKAAMFWKYFFSWLFTFSRFFTTSKYFRGGLRFASCWARGKCLRLKFDVAEVKFNEESESGVVHFPSPHYSSCKWKFPPKKRNKKSILWFHVILLFFLQSFPPFYFTEMKRYRRETENWKNSFMEPVAPNFDICERTSRRNYSHSSWHNVMKSWIEHRAETFFRYIHVARLNSDFHVCETMMKAIWKTARI